MLNHQMGLPLNKFGTFNGKKTKQGSLSKALLVSIVKLIN